MATTTHYYPEPIQGTSGHDHLAYEVVGLIPADGYATPAAARRGWAAACKRANQRRRELGYSSVTRPACRVVSK